MSQDECYKLDVTENNKWTMVTQIGGWESLVMQMRCELQGIQRWVWNTDQGLMTYDSV